MASEHNGKCKPVNRVIYISPHQKLYAQEHAQYLKLTQNKIYKNTQLYLVFEM